MPGIEEVQRMNGGGVEDLEQPRTSGKLDAVKEGHEANSRKTHW